MLELKEQNTLLKNEKDELNRRIQDQAKEITGELLVRSWFSKFLFLFLFQPPLLKFSFMLQFLHLYSWHRGHLGVMVMIT